MYLKSDIVISATCYERCVGDLQLISLPLWQHHGDGVVWAGPGGISWQKVNLVQLLRSPQSGDELCWSKQHGRGWAVYSNGRQLVLSRQKDSDWVKGNAGICPPTAWLQGQEKWRACRPVTSQVYTASGEKGKVNIMYAWQITWRVGGDENVYRPEDYCINVCTSLDANKMAEGSVNNGKNNRSTK